MSEVLFFSVAYFLVNTTSCSGEFQVVLKLQGSEKSGHEHLI